MGKFDGKVVIVTGASSGIGAATAIAFANEGANVTIAGRNATRLKEVADKCKEAGAGVLEVIGDLKKFEVLEPIITKTVEKFGKIDALVNNAGMLYVVPMDEVELEPYEDCFRLNTTAPVFLSKYAMPYLKKTKGSIVNVSSIFGIRAFPEYGTYSMTKAALDNYTRGLSAECAKFGVRVNSINPGGLLTRLDENSGVSDEAANKRLQGFLKTQALGIIPSEQVADSILHLCSSSVITGSCLVIDAGHMNYGGVY